VIGGIAAKDEDLPPLAATNINQHKPTNAAEAESNNNLLVAKNVASN